MADKPKAKRQVKNPETFRERALKASEADTNKSDRNAAAKRATDRFTNPASKPFKKAAKFKPVRTIGKVLVPKYVRNSWAELKKVTWPNWQQSRRLTTAVLIFAIIFGVIIAAVDWGLDRIFKDLILKT